MKPFCLHAACGIAHGKTTRLEFGGLQLVATGTGKGEFLFELDNPPVVVRNFLTGSPDPILEIWVDCFDDEPYEAVRYVYPTRRWWRARPRDLNFDKLGRERVENKLRSSTLANERCAELCEIEFGPLGGFELIKPAIPTIS